MAPSDLIDSDSKNRMVLVLTSRGFSSDDVSSMLGMPISVVEVILRSPLAQSILKELNERLAR